MLIGTGRAFGAYITRGIMPHRKEERRKKNEENSTKQISDLDSSLVGYSTHTDAGTAARVYAACFSDFWLKYITAGRRRPSNRSSLPWLVVSLIYFGISRYHSSLDRCSHRDGN